MFLEHLVYSAALALIVGMVFLRYTGRDPSWIIILMTIMPDSDYAVMMIMRALGFTYPVMITHGDFHNLVGMAFFSLCAALIFSRIGMKFSDVFICSVIGFSAHFIEDAFVYASSYEYLFPWSTKVYGWGIVRETGNIFGVAGTEVLSVGIVLFCIAVCIRMYFDGTGWTIRDYINDGLHFGRRVKYYTGIFLFGE